MSSHTQLADGGHTGAALDRLMPEKQIGLLFPLNVVDTTPYEFYGMVPNGIMLVTVPLGLKEFSRANLQEVLESLEEYLTTFKERGVNLIVHAGVPISILLGPERHEMLLKHVEEKTGIKTVSTLQCVLAAARALGIQKLAAVNKWDTKMNAVLTNFFEKSGIQSVATRTLSMQPENFLRMKNADGLTLAYQLAREALLSDPTADGLYIGGGSWLTAPLVAVLEAEFGRPVITNTTSFTWQACRLLGYTKPVTGYGRLFDLCA